MSINQKEQVILVDGQDKYLGVMEKLEAHQKGVLHRAISVFIVNSNGEWLLQQRAPEKYHSGGQWSNACCSHPRPGENADDAAIRRLQEEMGLTAPLEKLFHFTYRESMDHGLTEHEFDHVYFGKTDKVPIIDPAEVQDWKYLPFSMIRNEMENAPENFTPWFLRIANRVHRIIDP